MIKWVPIGQIKSLDGPKLEVKVEPWLEQPVDNVNGREIKLSLTDLDFNMPAVPTIGRQVEFQYLGSWYTATISKLTFGTSNLQQAELDVELENIQLKGTQ